MPTEERDVNVRSQPNVVSEIQPVVVGVLVDGDVVAVPVPVIGIGEVERRNAEIISAEPEAAWIASLTAPAVAAAEAAVKVAILPRMIDVVVNVVAAIAMSHPLTVVMNVRSFRMFVPVAVDGPGVVMMLAFVMVGVFFVYHKW